MIPLHSQALLLSSRIAGTLLRHINPAGWRTPTIATVTRSAIHSTASKRFLPSQRVKPIAAQPVRSVLQKSSSVHQHLCTRQHETVDPYVLLEGELRHIYQDIREEIELATNHPELGRIATYYFDGQGKALRPMITILMAKALHSDRPITKGQRQIAMISEMIHTASLVHDDVIDQSFARRGKPSVNVLWNQQQVAQAGDYILAVVSMMLARLQHNDVTLILSEILADLVQGELMQLDTKETENERFAHYFARSYRKTASLIANSLKAVAVLTGVGERTAEISFQYGRNLGLAFQLVDDLLDFVSSAEAMGKPAAVDLKLGLATAPVLFACEKFPELNAMIVRRFRGEGDTERAYELVHRSEGLEQTRFLARKHCAEARRLASQFDQSPYQQALVVVCDFVLNRMK